MFKMMNTERISVGIQGLGLAEIGYQNALAYALDRVQSKAPAPRPDDSKPADPIIYHPEIRRMLLRIRSQVEGARMMAVFVGHKVDVMDRSADDDARADAANTVALFTPVVKAYFSDLGMESTLAAQQVFGGHGYIREHGMEQLARDCRITQIYEGTNEIQAADLVLRKLGGGTGAFADKLLAAWREDLDARATDEFAAAAMAALDRLLSATAWIRDKLENDEAAARGAATNYLRLLALTSVAVFWAQAIEKLAGNDSNFAESKRKVALFYMQHVLPETLGLRAMIESGADGLDGISAEDFQH